MKITLLFGISSHSSGAKAKAILGGFRVQKFHRPELKLQVPSFVIASPESAHPMSKGT
jgi:hypothetical protein